MTPVYIHACGAHSALGSTLDEIHSSLKSGISPGMSGERFRLNDDTMVTVGRAVGELPSLESAPSHQQTRNNQLALSALLPLSDAVNNAKARFSPDRIAVVLGSSTSGIAEGERALKHHIDQGEFPKTYHYHQQELGNLSDFVSDYFGLTGLRYTVSTACSSSGRVFLTAKRLLKAGLADAVIVGGADSLCALTVNGFHGLDSVSPELCNPFGENRNGINIGEAAAFMLLSLEKPTALAPDQPAIALLGAGDSSDAHHISAPHPEGDGAERAMRKALDDAHLTASDIGYVNAHGTSTPLNDAMESKAILRTLGEHVPVSSTKPLTGHTLGAASAIEASICWHVLKHALPLPVSQHQQAHATDVAPIRLAQLGDTLEKPTILSNSFAFGGNNISLIFGHV